MALQTTDLLLVERGGVKYHMTADMIADFVGAVNDVSVPDIAGRDAVTDVKVGDRVFVADASADADVDAGWAIYRVGSIGPFAFDKVQEQESMDVVVVVNLGYTASTSSGTITNTAGDAATIPAVDATNAGLATPLMLANSHVVALAALTPTTNPITVDATTQAIDLNIGQLLALP